MITAAVACDGYIECHDGSDENWMCENISFVTWFGVAACLLLIMVIELFYKFATKKKNNLSEKTFCDLKISEYAFQEHNQVALLCRYPDWNEEGPLAPLKF